ncbi:MAG TPA: DUF4159 domain-containing protein [Tepidisphaeraceae bacterium]|nr:DUF4159 domain-containing protein [Tepidisphaeraceae bacterium]
MSSAAVQPEVIATAPPPEIRLRRADWRFRVCLIVAVLAHFALVAPSLINFSCTHDRPLGLPGGSGDKIAKGTPDGAKGGTAKQNPKPQKAAPDVQPIAKARVQDIAAAAQQQRSRTRFLERFSTDGLRAMLMMKDNAQVRPDQAQQARAAVDTVGGGPPGPPGPLGLEQGEGSGDTAAGSPFGNRIGAKLWLYRVKYSGGDWDANPKALPALLREVKLALKLKDVGAEEVVRMSDLPGHRGPNMPSMLFLTGTGAIQTTEADRAALRDYLLGGGMLVADSSGGNFEQQFVRLMAQVLPKHPPRNIEFDHDVYRGRWMPYKMPRGCPVYRDHGSTDAKGFFDDDGRLMAFFSPGDMGSAWAVVDLGRKRGDVEASFQMGTNLVTYSLMTVKDKRK